MQLSTTLSRARADGCVDPEHCRAAPAPSPVTIVARHDPHACKEAHCCLAKVHLGKVVPPQKLFNSLSIAGLVVAHAGERKTSALVPVLPSAAAVV